MTDDEAVDVGLCFGWISGQRKALDDLAAALAANAQAARRLRALNKTQRYAVILGVVTARTPEAREAQIRRAGSIGAFQPDLRQAPRIRVVIEHLEAAIGEHFGEAAKAQGH